MKYFTNSLNLLLGLGFMTIATFSIAQSTLSTYPGATANNGTAGITFQLITNQTISLEDIASQVFSSGTSTYTLWYHVGAYSTPPSITTAGGWVQLQSGTSATGTGTGGAPVTYASGLNLVLQPGTYGIHMTTSNCGYKSWAGSPDSWTDGVVTINTGQNIGYGGSAPSPSFHPRQFCGSITYSVVASAPNDAGVTSIDSPAVFCEGTHNVVATVKNFGINQVDSVTVNWAINGQTQTPVIYQQLLDTFNGNFSQTAQILLGSHSFTAGKMDTIEVWTTLPNNQQDTVTSNDSAVGYFMPALNGNFTIDPTGTGATNYTTFAAAAQDLSDFGVCGPVTYTVAPGTYTEQFELKDVTGASNVNTITFKPDPSGTVTVEFTPTSSQNYVVRLSGASYVSFEDMIFQVSSSAGTYATVLDINDGASYNSFMNCEFNGNANATTSSFQSVINCRTASNDYNKFHNNLVNGGSYGVYFFGGSTTSENVGNEWIGNTFKDAYYRGLYIYYSKDLIFNYNTLETNTTYLYGYGFMSYYANGASEVIGNHLSWSGYSAMYCFQYNGTASNYPVIANNMVNSGTGQYYTYGTYIYGGFLKVINNTIVKNSGSSYGYYGMYVAGGGNTVLNNIIYDPAGLSNYYTIYYSGGFAVLESDHNDIYSNGPNFGYFNGVQNSLSDWQNATGFDMNSLTTDPGFTNYDSLRTCNDTLDGAGTPVSYVTTDFDLDGRDPSTPDIGADEFIGADSGSYSAGPDAIVCDGKSVEIGLRQSQGTFLWSTSDTTSTITVSQSGTYQVSVTTACGATHTDEVLVEDVTPTATFTTTTSFRTGVFTNTSQNGNSYRWVIQTNPFDTVWAKDLTYVFPDNGPYQVCLTTYNDCDTVTSCGSFVEYLGVDERELSDLISLMPNPVSDVLTIQFSGMDDDQINLEMSNVQGQVVYTENFSNVNTPQTIDVSSLKKGLYILKFSTENEVTAKRIIVN
ncbi:MAG: T9SS type A sorting domain-containing protein [Vicingaceae bacterium]